MRANNSPHIGRRSESAVDKNQQAQSALPHDVVAQCKLAERLSAAGRHEEAILAYDAALLLQADEPSIHNDLGNALQKAGRLDGALDAYRHMLLLSPQNALAESNIGSVLQAQGEIELAMQRYQVALAIAPDFAAAHFNLERCKRDGQSVIGASSLAYDVSKPAYPEWAFLPYVNDPGFLEALQLLIAQRGIGGIYTPNPVVWSYLNEVLKDLQPAIPLVNASPVHDEMSGYRSAMAHARKTLATPLPIASVVDTKPALPELQLATLFRHANVIPGMCDDEKISALYEIARHSVRGDVVEIGSAWGKSAFVLARLARLHDIGHTLCIDPWQSDYVVQNDTGGLVDNCIHHYDYDEALRVFEMNLLPYSANDINYLRLPSVAAEQQYRQTAAVHSPSFGTTNYAGSIALLHIDGNHAYEAAQADIAAWEKHVVAGGWIIIDDYVWPYGDGPQRAGDEFLAQQQQRIGSAFVMGTALFLQLR